MSGGKPDALVSGLMDNHGSARRVPPPNATAWGSLGVWLGSGGKPEMRPASGELVVTTAEGREVARAGDWLIKTMAGGLHVGRQGNAP